ncbi:MAG: hypothetical protein JSW08_00855 [archaeon]|nr:MAG: hypothetical protein JSW08_00855 [archaeon]
MKNKKGVHHVEYVIAVSIFIICVLAVLYISHFSLRSNEGNSFLLLEKEFRERTEIPVKIANLTITTTKTCFNVPFNTNFQGSPDNLIIKEGGSVIDFNFDSSNNIHVGSHGSGKYSLFFSEYFESVSSGPTCDPTEDYSYSFIKEEEFVFYDKLEEFRENYSKDYREFRKQLGFDRDFSIIIKQGEEILFNITEFEPFDVRVYAKEFKIKIIDENANVQEALVNMRIW